MDPIKRLIAAGVLLLFAQASLAQSCYEWTANVSGFPGIPAPAAYHATPQQAVAAVESYCNASNANENRCNSTYCPVSQADAPTPNATQCTNFDAGALSLNTNGFPNYVVATGTLTRVQTDASGNAGTPQTQQFSVTVTARTKLTGCPTCPNAGDKRTLLPSENSQIPAGSGGFKCMNECEYQYTPTTLRIGAGDSQLATLVSTGRACGASSNNAEDGGEESDCSMVLGIGLVCVEQPSACGSVNGDVVCPAQVPDEACVEYRSGAMACDADAAAPPAPDNGTPNVPAQPDVQVTVNNQVVNYYNGGTVAGSSTPPEASPPQGGGPTGGSDYGSCEGDVCGPGEGSASGGESCSAPPVCSGDEIACAVLRQQWSARCPAELTDADLQGAVGTVPSVPSEEVTLPTDFSTSLVTLGSDGSCHLVSPIALPLGGEVDLQPVFDAFCDLAGMLAPLVMIGAYLSAAFIVFGVKGS